MAALQRHHCRRPHGHCASRRSNARRMDSSGAKTVRCEHQPVVCNTLPIGREHLNRSISISVRVRIWAIWRTAFVSVDGRMMWSSGEHVCNESPGNQTKAIHFNIDCRRNSLKWAKPSVSVPATMPTARPRWLRQMHARIFWPSMRRTSGMRQTCQWSRIGSAARPLYRANLLPVSLAQIVQ